MKGRSLIVLAAGIGIALLAWAAQRYWFPSDQTIIQRDLQALARAASFSPQQGTFARAYEAEKIASYFSSNAVIQIELYRRRRPAIHLGAQEIVPELAQAAPALRRTNVRLYDIHVQILPEKTRAVSLMTVLADINDEKAAVLEEIAADWSKENGRWRIRQLRSRPLDP